MPLQSGVKKKDVLKEDIRKRKKNGDGYDEDELKIWAKRKENRKEEENNKIKKRKKDEGMGEIREEEDLEEEYGKKNDIRLRPLSCIFRIMLHSNIVQTQVNSFMVFII
jgi:hypothetical protein